MGKYLNPGNDRFEEIRRDIYVDKSGLITYMNGLIGKPKPLVCFSRPRRFGKTFAADMLCAYYDKSCDSRFLFEDLKVADSDSFLTYLNQYNVLSFDVTGFITKSGECGTNILMKMQNALLEDLRQAFPDCLGMEEDSLADALYKIVTGGNAKFVFVIDEWDALFREFKDDTDLQRDYILFLRSLFKNKDITTKVIAAAYMTGILPVKKYGTESAVSDFKEFTMESPAKLAEYVGFTESEVRALCKEYHMDFSEMRTWYDGYSFSKIRHVYSPNFVMNAIQNEEIRNYWTKTESFEGLKKYIGINLDGLKDAVIWMLGEQRVAVDTGTFQNDITSFNNKDDVLTLLIHLGYLAYNQSEGKVYIPNREVAEIFRSSVKGGKWEPVARTIDQADRLLDATIRGECETVADSLELVHEECSSALTYHDENSLVCAIYIAYYTAKNYYTIIRELPTGKGFADYSFIPLPDTDRPAMIIELKYDKDADTAIKQIHDNRYAGALKGYSGNLLLVGINYDKDAKGKRRKKHSCVIERM
ncbi:MAG: ATP-binding protein [Lachnospiraceae bacterium]|nr:ATP-binding protein [Lachnospiraceae bacterium]